ncbi:MAG: hypothetical protein QOH46_977, partial [Solirubrobacteraceae bacterium]|nr:hypothetical protein [Solirubrobacteraceae bacterium]
LRDAQARLMLAALTAHDQAVA